MNELIELLQHKQLIWHATHQPCADLTLNSSGYRELDHHLEGGFNQVGVIELLTDNGVGELRLLLPTLVQDQKRLLVLIAPPAIVNSLALLESGIQLENILVILPDNQTQALWATEQCLASGSCHSVLLWPEEALAVHQIKRFQLAAKKGQSRTIFIRRERKEVISLPVDLSLSLQANESGLAVKINKRKGGWATAYFALDMQNQWPTLVKAKTADNVVAFPIANVS